MEFTFLDRQKELIISAPIDCVANNLSESIIYITLEINTRIRKDFVITVNTL